ncbi:MAG: hypothetical protein AAB681_02900 [Patescibacteria group bacterium]
MAYENNEVGPNLESLIKERFGEETDFDSLDKEALEAQYVNTNRTKNYFYRVGDDGSIEKLNFTLFNVPYDYIESLPEGRNVIYARISDFMTNVTQPLSYIVHEQVIEEGVGDEKHELARTATAYKVIK